MDLWNTLTWVHCMKWGACWATSHAECGISHKTLLVNKQNYGNRIIILGVKSVWRRYHHVLNRQFIESIWYSRFESIGFWLKLVTGLWAQRVGACMNNKVCNKSMKRFTLEWSYAQATLPGFSKQSLCVPFFNFTSLVSLPWRQLYEKFHYNTYYYSWLGYPLSH